MTLVHCSSTENDVFQKTARSLDLASAWIFEGCFLYLVPACFLCFV